VLHIIPLDRGITWHLTNSGKRQVDPSVSYPSVAGLSTAPTTHWVVWWSFSIMRRASLGSNLKARTPSPSVY